MGQHALEFRRGTIVLVAMAFLIGVFSASGVAAEERATLAGQVTTSQGKTIPFGVTVQILTPGGQIAGQQPANSAGHFEFDYIKKEDYTLTVTAKGFRPSTQDVDLRYGSQLFVTVQLTPVRKKAKSDRGAVVSVNDLKVPRHAKQQYIKGNRAFKARHFSVAKRYFERAVQEYPCYVQAQLGLATALIARKQSSPAEVALQKAIHCVPSFLDAYVELSQLFNAERHYGQSAKLLQTAIERSPNTWQLRYQMGVAHFGMNQFQKAEEDFLKVSSLNQSPPPLLYIKLADVYLKENAFGKAYAEMQSYLKKQPHGRFAPRIKTVIQRMKNDGLLSQDSSSAKPSRTAKP